jgi:hypothetical protein
VIGVDLHVDLGREMYGIVFDSPIVEAMFGEIIYTV